MVVSPGSHVPDNAEALEAVVGGEGGSLSKRVNKTTFLRRLLQRWDVNPVLQKSQKSIGFSTHQIPL